MSTHSACSAIISTARKIHSLCLSAVAASLCPVLTQRRGSHCFRCKLNNTPRGHLSLNVALRMCVRMCVWQGCQRSKHAIEPAVSCNCRKQDEMNRVVIRKEDVELIVSNTKTTCGCALPHILHSHLALCSLCRCGKWRCVEMWQSGSSGNTVEMSSRHCAC